jgi:beta-galactosidase
MDTQIQFTPLNQLHIGCAFYPEHWPEALWQEDVRLMHQAGFNTARLGDFAWSSFEPEAGRYELSWLERAISLLGEAGIDTVLCTPTASPPAWLINQYPDILPIDENGHRVQFGNRCHYCVNSPEYQQAAKNIVKVLGDGFGSNPHVIGWQIDNEFNRVCYCTRCQQLFQQYLAEKYITVEQLNQHWTTTYWSQTYNAWEQVPIPVGPHNPGLMLEFKHFVTLSYQRFLKLQIDELKLHLPAGRWVTHNYMDWYGGFDHYAMSEQLDMASWDWYVGSGNHDYLASGAAHDLVRGYKRKNFWLMETQPGNVNWTPVNSSLDKGEARAMGWHAVGHGAEAVLYWQWRSALNGQEQYHGTLVDPAGKPRPFYSDAQRLAKDFATTGKLIAGSKVHAEVALLNCYDSRWSIEWQPHHQSFSYIEHFLNYYRPLAAQNISLDVISADESLEGYKLVIAPTLLILNENRVAHLKDFVERGGHLLLTLRSGMKDEFNALLPSRQPGALVDLTGAEVEDYYALSTPIPVKGEGWSGESRIWAEQLAICQAEDTHVLASYGPSNGWLDGRPAITQHLYGIGMVTYVGVFLDEASQKTLLQQVFRNAGISPVMQTPAGVEACRRLGRAGEEIIILINHRRTSQLVQLPWLAYEHIESRELDADITLEPYGVAVLTHLA